MTLLHRFSGISRPLILMVLRMATTAAKFLLALYTARYLGLADLGIYGLLVGGTVLVPALLGLGTSDWVLRQIVVMPRSEALESMTTRLALPVVLHAVAQPLLWLVNVWLGTPVPWTLILPCGLIMLLEHLSNDASDLLIARNHAVLATALSFVRSGLWPLAVILWGLLDPSARTLGCLLTGWIGGLLVLWAILAAFVATGQRWRHLRLRWRWLLSGMPASLPFYVKDLAAAASMHLDRFVISLFLGLEMTGVYTLFWSITNVVHNLAVYAVVQPQVPILIAANAHADNAAFQSAERRIRLEAIGWTAALSISAVVVVPILLPFLGRPALQANLPIFWLILLATLMRIGADGYGFLLLTLHQDRSIAVISVAGAIASAVLNVLLIPWFGLAGAALAYLLTGAGLLAARSWVAGVGKASLNAATPQPIS